MEKRIAAIGRAVPALDDAAVIQAQVPTVQTLAKMIQMAGEGILRQTFQE